ncbi:Pro-Pol polyprotein [Bienertia sinuspersici]
MHYGLPICLVFDHGKQFYNDDIKEFLNDYHVKFASSTVCHPQSNEKVKGQKGKWLFELHSTLLSLKTTQRESTWQTPFLLVYNTEALMPVELERTSLRV